MFWGINPAPLTHGYTLPRSSRHVAKGPRAMSSLINETDNLHEIFETLLSVLEKQMHLAGALSLLEPVIFSRRTLFPLCILCRTLTCKPTRICGKCGQGDGQSAAADACSWCTRSTCAGMRQAAAKHSYPLSDFSSQLALCPSPCVRQISRVVDKLVDRPPGSIANEPP